MGMSFVRESSTEPSLWIVWLYKQMRFPALFKLVKCSEHRQGDCSKQLGLRRWTHACQAPDGCAGRTECHEQLTGVKNANQLKRWERKVRRCKTVQSRKVPCTPSNTVWTRSAPVHAASGGCPWAVASHDLADGSCRSGCIVHDALQFVDLLLATSS